MKIRVECYAGGRGDETPRRIFFDGRSIEVVEVIDRWFGPDHQYFKVRGADQATYILRQDIPSHGWELTVLFLRTFWSFAFEYSTDSAILGPQPAAGFRFVCTATLALT